MFGIGMGVSGQEKQQYDVLDSIGKFGSGQMTSLLPQGVSDITSAQNYFKTILSGNRSEALRMLSPEVRNITQAFDVAKKQGAEFAPRSGGRAATLSNARFEEGAGVTNMLAAARPAAASALNDIGKTLSMLGLDAGKLGEGAAKDAFSSAQIMQEQSAAQWGDIFKSISSIAGVAGKMLGGKIGDILKGAAGVMQPS